MSEIINKLDLKSLNISEDKKAKLKELFPEVFSEDKIDFDKLKITLGEDIADSEERFGLQWAGKKDCFKVIQEPSVGTLKPCKEESINWDTTENLFIEGDNLEVLKQLQKAYYGKVKMIYIDPPYNTGGEFIYPDRFQENLDTYLAYTGQVNDEGKKFSTNTETSGRFHSNWLNMMYPRLFLARNLLKNDGVIFLSIDDNEVDNLRKVCNEIFGEENFIECISWNKRIPKNDKGIGNIHEYILVYVKDNSLKHEFIMAKNGLDEINVLLEKLKKSKTSLKDSEVEIKKLYNKKGYDRAITLYNSLDKNYRLFGKINLSWPNSNTIGPKYEVLHPITKKPVNIPDRGWRWKKESFDEALGNNGYEILNDNTILHGKIWFGKDENLQPSSVLYLDEVDTMLLRSILSFKSDGGIEVEKLFNNKNYFPYPKPTSILKVLFHSLNSKNGIFLDFFSGSCSTAHAVLDLNKEDGGNRKFIMVQLPEPCDEKSEAFKAGYKTIADIGKERIRRVIKKVEAEVQEEEIKNQGKLELEESKPKKELDLGFKVFKLDRSNFKTWDGNTENDGIQNQLEKALFHIDTKSSEEDILTEILLKSGFQLTVKLEEIRLVAKKVFSIADGSLIVCLDKDITKELIQEIAKLEPARVVCLDSGFKERDELKTNTIQIMKSHGVDDFRTV
jgi:adenine-specific DNA-methyltransferase